MAKTKIPLPELLKGCPLRLHLARTRAGVSQMDAARVARVSRPTMMRLEAFDAEDDFVPPDLGQVVRLAEFYGTDPAYLAFGDESRVRAAGGERVLGSVRQDDGAMEDRFPVGTVFLFDKDLQEAPGDLVAVLQDDKVIVRLLREIRRDDQRLFGLRPLNNDYPTLTLSQDAFEKRLQGRVVEARVPIA